MLDVNQNHILTFHKFKIIVAAFPKAFLGNKLK